MKIESEEKFFAMASLERRLKRAYYPNNQEPYYLKYAKNYTSQGGEDGILEEIFNSLYGTHEGETYFCIDIGAWDGIHLSNTYHLLNDLGWSGILVEAEPERCNSLKQLYAARAGPVCCLNALVDLEGPNSLQSLLRENNCPSEPNFVSIDIDGADFHLWKSIGLHYKAHVVCIEFNPSIPNSIYYVQANDVRVQQGSSLLALVELGKDMGYEVVSTTTFNAIFVRQDLYIKYLPAEKIIQDINFLHLPYMATELFQTYDGELKFVGTKKLLWHKKSLNSQQLQILPKKDRKYPFAPDVFIHLQQLQSSLQKVIDLFTIVDSKEYLNLPVVIVEANEIIQSYLKLLTLSYVSEQGFQLLQAFFYQLWMRSGSKFNDVQFSILISFAFQLYTFAQSRQEDDVLQAVEYAELSHLIINRLLCCRHMTHLSSIPSYILLCDRLLIDIQVSLARFHCLLQRYLEALQRIQEVRSQIEMFRSDQILSWGNHEFLQLEKLRKSVDNLYRKCQNGLAFETKLEINMSKVSENCRNGEFSPYEINDSIKINKNRKLHEQAAQSKSIITDHNTTNYGKDVLLWVSMSLVIGLGGIGIYSIFKPSK